MNGWGTATGRRARTILREAGELPADTSDIEAIQAAAIRFVSKRLLWRFTFTWHGSRNRVGIWTECGGADGWKTLNGMAATCGDTFDEALACAVCNARIASGLVRCSDAPHRAAEDADAGRWIVVILMWLLTLGIMAGIGLGVWDWFRR